MQNFPWSPVWGMRKQPAVSVFGYADIDRFDHVRSDLVTGAHIEHCIDRVVGEAAARIGLDLYAVKQIIA